MSTVALVHAAASLVLAGIGWVVQVVVYPAFALVPTGAWQRYHATHGHGSRSWLAHRGWSRA